MHRRRQGQMPEAPVTADWQEMQCPSSAQATSSTAIIYQSRQYLTELHGLTVLGKNDHSKGWQSLLVKLVSTFAFLISTSAALKHGTLCWNFITLYLLFSSSEIHIRECRHLLYYVFSQSVMRFSYSNTRHAMHNSTRRNKGK